MWFFIKRAKNDKKGQNIGKFGQKSENVNLKIFWKRARKGPARKGPACTSFFSCEFCQFFKNSCILWNLCKGLHIIVSQRISFFQSSSPKVLKIWYFFIHPLACLLVIFYPKNDTIEEWCNQRFFNCRPKKRSKKYINHMTHPRVLLTSAFFNQKTTIFVISRSTEFFFFCSFFLSC